MDRNLWEMKYGDDIDKYTKPYKNILVYVIAFVIILFIGEFMIVNYPNTFFGNQPEFSGFVLANGLLLLCAFCLSIIGPAIVMLIKFIINYPLEALSVIGIIMLVVLAILGVKILINLKGYLYNVMLNNFR